jgi:hypothetical protein
MAETIKKWMAEKPPTLVNGRLYVRSHTQLVCLDLAAK